MAIAQLIETLDAGGAEALAVEIANALADMGLESHLIVIDGGGRFQARIAESVHIHDLGSPRCLGRLPARVLYFARIHRRLARIVADNRITVIQTHLPKANFFGLLLAAMQRIRVHPTVHNNREFDYGDSPGYLIEKGRRLAYRSMLRVNAEMVAVSQEVKAALAIELGVDGTPLADRIVAVANGVVCADELSADSKTKVRSAWQIRDEEVLLVAAGRLTRQKNYSTLIEALHRLPPGLPDWKCIIGGEGELRDSLQARIDASGLSERISLPGHIADLRDLMAAADVFCLSSIFEGLPLVMLEAMSCRLPICAFGIPGVTDVITHEREGLLARPEDSSNFAEMCGNLIGDRSLRKNLGESARRLVEEKYSFTRMLDRLVTVYGGDETVQSS